MALFNNLAPVLFNQSGFAPPPNFNFGPSTANCGPCGNNPASGLPEQPPAPTAGNPDPCNPTNIAPTFNPQPSGQPKIPTNPFPDPWRGGGGNPFVPPATGQNPIWPGPQGGLIGGGNTGKAPPQRGQPILWNPQPWHPSTTPIPPDKYIPPQTQQRNNPTPAPNPWIPSCGITGGPQMVGLPVNNTIGPYQGWINNGSANLPYSMMQGTGIGLTQYAAIHVNPFPYVPTSPPAMFGSGFKRPFFLPSEIPPQSVSGCGWCIA